MAQGGNIFKYSPAGEELARWPVPGAWELNGLGVSASGDLFALDGYNRRVHRLSPAGTPLASWDLPGLSAPSDLAVDAQSHVYVVDGQDGAILVFDSDGAPLDEWDVPRATAIAIDARDHVWVFVDPDTMLELAPDGQVLRGWPTAPEDALASGIAVDDGGNLYLQGVGNVSVRTPSGLRLASGARSNLSAMAVAADGTILIADCNGGARITWISTFAPLPPGIALATNPGGQPLAVDGVVHEAPFYIAAPAGSAYTIAASPEGEPDGDSRYDFVVWSDGSNQPSRTVLTSQYPGGLEARFVRKYPLTMSATSGGAVTPGTGWFEADSVVEVRAIPSANSRFLRWTLPPAGEVGRICCTLGLPCCTPQTIYENPTTVLMDGPRVVQASFIARSDLSGMDDHDAPASAPAALMPPSPNPFSVSSAIAFALPSPQPVRVSIYDVTGRLVRVVLHEESGSGSQTVHWDGRDAHGVRVARGTYFVRLQAGSRSTTRKLVFLGD